MIFPPWIRFFFVFAPSQFSQRWTTLVCQNLSVIHIATGISLYELFAGAANIQKIHKLFAQAFSTFKSVFWLVVAIFACSTNQLYLNALPRLRNVQQSSSQRCSTLCPCDKTKIKINCTLFHLCQFFELLCECWLLLLLALIIAVWGNVLCSSPNATLLLLAHAINKLLFSRYNYQIICRTLRIQVNAFHSQTGLKFIGTILLRTLENHPFNRQQMEHRKCAKECVQF